MAITEQEKIDICKAFLNGQKVETVDCGHWYNVPSFSSLLESIARGYPVRLKPKSDAVFCYWGKKKVLVKVNQNESHNLRITFDGETGDLKSAEVVNK